MQDRRTAARYRLPLLMTIKRRPGPKQLDILYGRVRDISTSGIYFTSQERLVTGEKLEFSVTLPTEGADSAEVSVKAQARVVRVEQKQGAGGHRLGVAAVIEHFQTIRTKGRTF